MNKRDIKRISIIIAPFLIFYMSFIIHPLGPVLLFIGLCIAAILATVWDVTGLIFKEKA